MLRVLILSLPATEVSTLMNFVASKVRLRVLPLLVATASTLPMLRPVMPVNANSSRPSSVFSTVPLRGMMLHVESMVFGYGQGSACETEGLVVGREFIFHCRGCRRTAYVFESVLALERHCRR